VLRKRIAWIAVSGLLLLAVLTVLGFRETSKPAFCSSCHIIEPFRASWVGSSHQVAGVDCVDCHFEPGAVGYIKGKTYSFIKLTQFAAGATDREPEAGKLVLGSACIQCHEYVRDPEDPRYPTDIVVEGITFPHEFHVDEANLQCADCHSGVVHGSELVGPDRAQAAADPEFCGSCHTGEFAPILFGEIEPVGREHPGAPKIDVNVWRNTHWMTADGPAVIDGVEYDQIERETCLACHQEPTVAKACKSCHSARVPEFSASPEAQRASTIPVLLFGFLFVLFMLAVFLRRGEKERLFTSIYLRLAAVAVLITDAFVVYLIVRDVLQEESGHHEIGPTTVYVTYLLLSIALVAFLMFEANLLPMPLHRTKLPRQEEDVFLVPKPIRRMKARSAEPDPQVESAPDSDPTPEDDE
jgi:nitrate/TMAO reductase-like tetraheme cytochrome c subunit